GEAMFMSKSIQSSFSKNAFKHDIIFTGRIPDEELALLLGSAYALAYVPLFEGFGIPILESFACDVPVITSNCTSMPEVAGDAALLCDPESTDDIMHAMIRIAEDSQFREQLIENARVQRQKFSWDLTAEALWKSVLKS